MKPAVSTAFLGALATVLAGSGDAPKPVASGPISYYNGACAHCHGVNGSAYGPDFFKKHDLPALTKSIKEMAEGPGQSPLDPAGLKAQVAYHQAIIAHAPFLAWTGQSGQKLTGEVTRKSTVEASIGRAKIPVTVKGINWSLDLPTGTAPGKVVLTAKLNNVTATVSLAKSAYSTLAVPWAQPVR